MIGRVREQQALAHWLGSPRSEFVVVYGRRRVGKTYLVERYFGNRFAFRVTGTARVKRAMQLRNFNEQLIAHGMRRSPAPKDWFEAFARLGQLLSNASVTRDPSSGKLVVFIDEMPWLDTQRSDFKEALEYFWNTWAAPRDDVLLIACGSATSWLTKNLLKNTGGLYGRVTGRLHLQPFTLGEVEQLLRYNGVEFTRQQVIELYLVFGGIPYYIDLVRRGLSPAQAVDQLCFSQGALLEGEYELLFRSLFPHAENYMAVVEALGGRGGGLTNAELRGKPRVPTGTALTRVLEDLVLCGFVSAEDDFTKRRRGKVYRLTDPFTYFYLRFLKNRAFDSWTAHTGTPGYVAWRGLAFERCCIAHVAHIKQALGISGVETRACMWRGESGGRKAQVDLLIDRRDGIIDICEAKFTDGPYVLDRAGHEAMIARRDVFGAATGTKKALHLVLIAAAGVAPSTYLGSVQKVIAGDALFADLVEL